MFKRVSFGIAVAILAAGVLFSCPSVSLAATTHAPVPFSPHTSYSPVVADLPLSCNSYTIRWGDTLGSIAASHGTTWQTLAAINNIANPNLIYAGHTLCLSGGGASTAPATNYVAPAPTSTGVSFGPCQSSNMFGTSLSSWAIPSGCYGGIYSGVKWQGAADCFALVQYYTNGRAAYLVNSTAPHGSPVVGAVMRFPGGNQGASPSGHYGMVVGVGPGGWILLLEQNMYWRGGGYDLQSYRYVYSTGMFYY